MSEKKNMWVLDVNRMSALKVVFAESVTKEEAISLFGDDEYEDIIDEEDFGTEVVGAQ